MKRTKFLKTMGILSVGAVLPLGNISKELKMKNFEFFKNIEQRGAAYKNAIPTPDHYWPALYSLAAMGKDEVSFFNEYYAMGSLSMHSFKSAS